MIVLMCDNIKSLKISLNSWQHAQGARSTNPLNWPFIKEYMMGYSTDIDNLWGLLLGPQLQLGRAYLCVTQTKYCCS